MFRALLQRILVIGFLGWSICIPVKAEELSDPPDVLFISVDELNDCVSTMKGHHPQAHTLNIDRLAEQGVLFNNAHTQTPLCKPSRESLMSGKLPSTTGMYLLGDYYFCDSPALQNHVVLPEHLRNQGYRVLGTGKLYHMEGEEERELINFDEYGPLASAGPFHDEKINYPNHPPLWDWEAFSESDKEISDYNRALWAIEQLDKKHEHPFFLGVGGFRPHVPLYVPKHWFDKVPDEEDVILPKIKAEVSRYARKLTYSGLAPRHKWLVENGQWKRTVRAYLVSIQFVDHHVGRLLDALKHSIYSENTIIVLSSDHGFALGERQRWAKRALWEPETRVPFIFAGPGIPEGLKTDQPAELIDIYLTLIESSGFDKVSGLEGQSLVPQLHDLEIDREPVITTFWINNHAIRSRNFRYIQYANGEEELYDHRVDSDELNNLVGDSNFSYVIKRLLRFLPEKNAKPISGNSSRSLGVHAYYSEQFNFAD